MSSSKNERDHEPQLGKYTISEITEEEDDLEELSDFSDIASTGDAVPIDQEFDYLQDDYSTDDYKPHLKAGVSVQREKPLKIDKHKYKYSEYIKHEREVHQYVKQLEARDLTYHILSVHGFRARQRMQSQARAGTAIRSLTDEKTGAGDVEQLNRGIRAWKPRRGWDRWPLRASLVPRPQPRVWNSSIAKPEPATSRSELQDTMFAFLLKTAHLQWKGRSEESWLMASRTGQSSAEQQTDTSTADEDGDAAVFSADDERSLRILQPAIVSTVSSLDNLLTVLRKSCAESRSRVFEKKPGSIFRPAAPVDWRQSLGLASIIGVSPAALARATTRCAAAFEQDMSFSYLREEDAQQPLPAPTFFTPNDIHSATDAAAKFAEEPALPPDWTPEDGCPYPKCSFFGTRFPRRGLPKGQTSQMHRLRQHMKVVHFWKNESEPPDNLEEDMSGMSGAVHVDGYMKPMLKALNTTWTVSKRKAERQTTDAEKARLKRRA